jgi:hypothetical protein
MLRLFIFFVTLFTADVYFFFVPEKGNGKTYIFLQPHLLRDKGMSKMTAAATTISRASNFSFFFFPHFLKIEERPILRGALGYAWVPQSGSWANTPIFQTN